MGGSLGLDYQPIRHAQLRLEARYLGASNDYFVTAEGPNNRQLYLTAAIAASF
jgi:hypothetical protein